MIPSIIDGCSNLVLCNTPFIKHFVSDTKPVISTQWHINFVRIGTQIGGNPYTYTQNQSPGHRRRRQGPRVSPHSVCLVIPNRSGVYPVVKKL